MTLRLYFNNSAPSYAPTPLGSWNTTAGYISESLLPTKAGANASRAMSETVSTNHYTMLAGIWTSEPFLQGATIPTSDTLEMVIAENASNTSSFGDMWRVYVTAGDSATIRGTLIDVSTTIATGTTAGSSGWNARSPTAAVAVQAGDRLVMEIGAQTLSTVTTTRTYTIWYGNGGGADFVFSSPGDTAVTTKCGWTELTGVLETLWTAPPVPPGAFLPFFGQ